MPCHVPEQFLWRGREHCPAGSALPSGSDITRRLFTWSASVFGLVLCVQWLLHE